MRIMAVDYGDRRTGIAVSDLLGVIAGDAWTIDQWNSQALAEEIGKEAKSRQVSLIVLGNPVNMDGSKGPRAEKSMEFGKLLGEVTGIEVVMWDERLTTVDAHRILTANDRHGKKRKNKVDAVAATLILEGYLQSIR